jgi:hypothetical protein
MGGAEVNIKRTWGWTGVIDRRSTVAIVAAFVVILTGCVLQVVAPPQPGKGEPAEFPGAHYRALLAQGKPVFRVDPARSIVVIEVRRGGSLARLGHDHVVASHDLAGFCRAGRRARGPLGAARHTHGGRGGTSRQGRF